MPRRGGIHPGVQAPPFDVAGRIAACLAIAFLALQAPVRVAEGAPLFRNTSPVVGDDPQGVATGDLDGDGLIDLAAAIPYDNEVAILFGKGDLTFTVPIRLPVGGTPNDVAMEDLDGDGLDDVIMSNSSSEDLSVLLSAADRSFLALERVSLGRTGRALVVRDFDRDGRPDVAVATFDGISVFLGDGDGTFGPEARFLSGTAVRSIDAGEFDGDARTDLVYSLDSKDTIGVLNGQGNGTFVPGFTTRPACGGDHAAAGDIDADGLHDIVSSGLEVAVVRSRGGGAFRQVRCIDERAEGPIAIARLDSDEHVDFAIGGVFVFLGSGDGRFAIKEAVGRPGAGAASLDHGDLDRDGREDLVVTRAGSGYIEDAKTIWVLAGNGDGTFGPPVAIESNCVINSIDVGDLNGDGLDDIAAALGELSNPQGRGCSLGLVAVHLSNGNGSFGPASHFGTGTIDTQIPIIVGDVDGDGDADLVLFDQTGLHVLLGLGDGTFVEGGSVPFGVAASAGVIDDFNEDGRGDVIAVNHDFDSGFLSLRLNDGAGGWLPERTVPFPPQTPNRAGGVATGDFDRDGHRDLVVWGYLSRWMFVLPGNGDGTFQTVPSYSAAFFGPVAVGDLDGDGRDDLAPGSPAVLRGRDDGTFEQQPRPGPTADTIVAADFNGDGRLDLGLGERSRREEPGLTVLIGRGNGTFADPLPFWGEGEEHHAGRFDALGGDDLAVRVWPAGIIILDNGAPIDLDADGVPDAADNCTLAPNAAQTNADGDPFGDACDNCPLDPNPDQGDADADGAGDLCDPCTDTDGDGFGDPGFPASACPADGCPADPHPAGDGCRPDELIVLAVRVRDLNGDLDRYADPGEIARISVTIRNDGPRDLSGVTLALTSGDPDVSCVTRTTIDVGELPAGPPFDTAALGDPDGEFEFLVAGGARTDDPINPATGDFILWLTSHETSGRSIAQPLRIPLDLDPWPGSTPSPVPGTDGIAGTGDDGIILERFDIDGNGDGRFSVEDTFLQPSDVGGTVVYSGSPGAYLRGADAAGLPGRVTAVACAGFQTVGEGNPACRLDPDFPIDWHFHCPVGATDCPNDEILPGDAAPRACVGGCSYDTPANGTMALSPPNSLHMGAHFDPIDAHLGDTTHLRALQAYMTPPINLTAQPGDEGIELSFFHIIDLVDNNVVGLPDGICGDCANVQIQVDLDPDPSIDAWGFWDRLVPFENGYEHRPDPGTFGPYYCLFTPADTGDDAPAPRGVEETLCALQGAWSNCGSDIGTGPNAVGDCDGPGFLDPSGTGVWVQSRFDLGEHAGHRIRIRWIGASWVFSQSASSYFEYGFGWEGIGQDDGWWLDDVRVTGAVDTQDSRLPDDDPAAGGVCPILKCDPSIGDNGTGAALSATDLAGNVIDGIGVVAIAGGTIRITAAGSSLPGGCVDGVPEYRFFRKGVLARDWSTGPSFEDAPASDALYSVRLRCSSDHACTSATGRSVAVEVYRGDGAGIALSLAHDGATGVTDVTWPSRPQIAGVDGYDLYAGTIGPNPGPLDPDLLSIVCLEGDIPQPAAGPGVPISVADGSTPPPGRIAYYLAGHNPTAPGALAALGLRSDGTPRPPPPVSCP